MFVVNGRFLTQKPTGVHRYAFEICNKLYEMGVDFYVVTPKEINSEYKCSFRTVKCGNLSTHLWEQIDLPRYLKKNSSPLLVSFSGCGPFNYTNQIITIHDVSYEVHPEWFSKSFFRYYHFMMPRIAKKSHAVITVSEFSKREIKDVYGLPDEKIYVVNGAIPHRSNLSDEEILQYEPESTAGRYILTVSSMDPRKNFVRLVEAFDKLKDKSVKLYIIGMQFKAFNTPDLQKLVGENVVMPGYVDDEQLHQLYRDALFSIYPSLYEGFGFPPLESMSYGCPVIASDIPALKEVSGEAALYANPMDIDDMVEKMNHLVEDDILRQQLKRKGLEQVKKYSWDRSAEKVLQVVNRFL